MTNGVLLTTKEAARQLGISPSTLSRYTRSGELPTFKIGTLVRIAPSDLAAFIERRRRQAAAVATVATINSPEERRSDG